MGTIKINQANMISKRDIQKSLSGDELIAAVHERIDKFADKEQVITPQDMEESYSAEEFKAVMRQEIHEIFNK